MVLIYPKLATQSLLSPGIVPYSEPTCRQELSPGNTGSSMSCPAGIQAETRGVNRDLTDKAVT